MSGEGAASEYRNRLLEAGLLIDTGVPGLYGRSRPFEAVVEGIERMASAAAGAAGGPDPEYRRFPPVMARSVLEGAGYGRSFPNLLGVVTSFEGDDRDHAALLRQFDDGDDWARSLVPTDTVL